MKPLWRAVRIFLIGSEFFSTAGGIQRVNCMLLEMLGEFAATTPTEVEIFSFADQAGASASALASRPEFRWHAFARSRGAMARGVAWKLIHLPPDLALFTHANLLPLAGLVHLLRPAAKVAVLAHGVEVWKTLPAPVRRSLQKADAVIAPSVFTRDKIIETNGVESSRVAVLPHGLDASWRVADGGTRQRGRKCLLSVSRLRAADRYKGVDTVLRALPTVLKQHPEIIYKIAGDGDDRARLQKLATDLGVENGVEFCGEVTGHQLHDLYSQADIFVLPSQEEGFGIVFLEAMSYGLPVVAARAAATPEVVQDEITGLLMASGQPGAIAENLGNLLGDLLGDEARCRALGDAGRQRVLRAFQFEHFSRRWQRLLVELLPQAVYLARQTAAFSGSHQPVSELEAATA
jgi:glycosyltransferase involved in cell wall biosynthesis